jgi:hypothetical protein
VVIGAMPFGYCTLPLMTIGYHELIFDP